MKALATKKALATMFAEAARQIGNQRETLSKLDSMGGDGDHGATMTRVMQVLENAIDVESYRSASTMLKEAGWAVMNVDGGASSAIVGAFVDGMGQVEFGEELDPQALADSFESGLRSVSRQTRAGVGDKTILDALIPAVEAFRQAVQAGKSVRDAMTIATSSAESGANSTKTLVARFGRARSAGERTLGWADPGAVSVGVIFTGFRDALNSIDESENNV